MSIFGPIPLPKVVADVGPGGGIPSAMNALNQLQISGAEAQYAPYTQYANALSKEAYANMLPYQIQATVLGNPLLWAAMEKNPKAMEAMINNFAGSASNMNNVSRLPKPGSMGGGVFGALMKKLGIIGEDETPPNNLNGIPSSGNGGNAMAEGGGNYGGGEFGSQNYVPPGEPTRIVDQRRQAAQQAQGSPLVPSSRGTVPGIAGSQTGQYRGETQKPGTSFFDPQTGTIVSSLTESQRTAAQNAISAFKRVEPQLKRLSKLAGPFLSLKGEVKNLIGSAYNYVANPKNPAKLPAQHAEYKATLEAAPEALVKSYGLNPTNETITRMEKVITPRRGETDKQYLDRMSAQIKEMKAEQVYQAEQQLAGGLTVSGGQTNESYQEPVNEADVSGQMPPPGTRWMISKENIKVPVHESRIPQAKKEGFREVE